MTSRNRVLRALAHEEVPWESVLAFHDAVRTFGAYPFPGLPSRKK